MMNQGNIEEEGSSAFTNQATHTDSTEPVTGEDSY